MKPLFVGRTILLAVCLVASFSRATGADRYEGRCDVAFRGDSTLHGFGGDVSNLWLKVERTLDPGGRPVVSMLTEVTVKQLTTHHAKRDANMHKMFAADRFPLLTVTVSNAPLAEARLTPAEAAQGPGKLPLRMTICGISRDLEATTRNVAECPDGWEFDLEYDVSLKAFKLAPPTAVLGTVRVRDTVKVQAHVKLTRANAQP
jgi:hypothetical protein